MNRRLFFLPVALLTAFAGYLGWRLGQPLSDTDLINRAVATYVSQAPAGAAPTDCLAIPGDLPSVRIVLTCRHAGGDVFITKVGPRGTILPATEGPDA